MYETIEHLEELTTAMFVAHILLENVNEDGSSVTKQIAFACNTEDKPVVMDDFTKTIKESPYHVFCGATFEELVVEIDVSLSVQLNVTIKNIISNPMKHYAAWN